MNIASSSLPAIFQFTPLREGRRKNKAARDLCLNFNSRPCVRGDERVKAVGKLLVFQFTPLREGRRWKSAGGCGTSLFQFTPLREGRLVSETRRRRDDISIHAPA